MDNQAVSHPPSRRQRIYRGASYHRETIEKFTALRQKDTRQRDPGCLLYMHPTISGVASLHGTPPLRSMPSQIPARNEITEEQPPTTTRRRVSLQSLPRKRIHAERRSRIRVQKLQQAPRPQKVQRSSNPELHQTQAGNSDMQEMFDVELGKDDQGTTARSTRTQRFCIC